MGTLQFFYSPHIRGCVPALKITCVHFPGLSLGRGASIPKTLEHSTLKTLEFTRLLLDTGSVASYNVTINREKRQEARR